MATEFQNTALALAVGLFDASPGELYLNQFTQSLIDGRERAALANDLTQTNVFKSIFSESLSNNEFATQYIGMLAGSTASSDSVAWAVSWLTDYLNSDASITRADGMLRVIDALLGMPKNNANWGATAQLFENKLRAAADHSIEQKGVGNLSELQAVFSGVDASAPTADQLTLFSMDFDNHSVGVYSEQQYLADTGLSNRSSKNNDLSEVVEIDGDNMLQVTLPQGEAHSGFQAYIDLNQNYSEIYFSYQIRIDSSFDTAVKGGKLPGIGAVNPTPVSDDDLNATGGNIPAADEGFTSRFMYRQEQEIKQYLYHQDMSGTSGEYGAWQQNDEPFQYPLGETIQLEQYLKVNTPGVADGEIIVWADNQVVYQRSDFMFSESGTYGVNRLYIDIWAGGAQDDSDWFPANDSILWIDDIIASTVPVAELSTDNTIELTSEIVPLSGLEM